MTSKSLRFRPRVVLLDDRSVPGSVQVPGFDAPFGLESQAALASSAESLPIFVGEVSWNFDLHPGALPNPLPGPPPEWSLVGSAGTLDGHLSVTQVNPTKENATFTLQGFQGSLTLFGQDVIDLGLGYSQVSLQTTQPTDVRVELHYGAGPSKPMWTFHADHPVLIVGDGTVIGAVQSAQVVGGRVVFMR
jgi:hypothetical protein